MSTPAKLRLATSPVIFTANALRDGRVAWLGAGDAWVARLADAVVFSPEDAATGLTRAQQGERRQLVVGVYAVEVAVEDGMPTPLKFRERLRSAGPSIAAEPPGYRLAS